MRRSARLAADSRLTGFSVLLAVLFHAAWISLPLRSPPSREGAPIVSMEILHESHAWVWSPTLFSLPTRLGFSGALMTPSPVVAPPLESPLQLAMSTRLRARDDTVRCAFPDPADMPAFARLSPGAAFTARPAPSPESLQWQLFLPGKQADALEGFRSGALPPQPAPLHIHGILEFDEFGMVSQLLLGSPDLNPELRDPVLRALRQVRLPKGEGPVREPFRLSFQLPETAP